MDKAETKKQPIKITFLEINPPISELIKNKEEINIIFQGNDNFYDFKKYLSSKIPIIINRYKNSLIMTLVKSNNIFATGLFIIRKGEQNVVFNYESKKKHNTSKAVNINNLLDCIKIKIFCEFDTKDKNNISSLNINNNINDNKNNDSASKYVPKVNLMKSSHLKGKNNQGKKIFEKKKKVQGNFYINNSIKKNNLINSSQEFSLGGGEYSAFLTEEINNNSKHNNNFHTNEIKKLSPYCSSKINNNLIQKTEIEMSAKVKGRINKAKSKNYFSTIKKQYRQSYGNQIKLNNSSLNLINQKNSLNSIDNYENLNKNPNSNRILKPTISFNKNNKRNLNNNKAINNNKNLINSIDNFISGQIIEHVDMSKKDNKKTNHTNSEKKSAVNINKNINNLGGNFTLNNENKKRKFNNNNVTMNSISTAGTKKNDLEYSINSLLDCKDYDDKNIINKNGFMPFTNRLNNERLQQKLKGNNSNNGNCNKHKFNKSLCQQSFIDKIFNENDFNLNINEKDKKNSNNCESCPKLQNGKEDLNLNQDNKENKICEDEDNKLDLNKDEIKEFQEENMEFESYERIKEDFNLLYNEEYIKQINEDLLKLEIELFFEKMAELFSTYHLLMDEKILENQIIKRDCKKNIYNYLLYEKLNHKLQLIKTQKQAKQNTLKEKGINLDKQNSTNLYINIDELNIFKMIFPDEDKTKKLKKIISVILKKQENKELLDDKLKFLVK